MNIPTKITPCPLVEAVVEIKFDSDINPDAIFGIIYSEFIEEYTTTTKLPILQVPEAIRLKDPNLVYQPHYKLSKDNFIFQVGPKMISINNTKEYVGWDSFKKKVEDNLIKIESLGIIKEVKRLGLRYINFYKDKNIFEDVKLTCNLEDRDFKDQNLLLRTEMPSDGFNGILQIANKSKVIIDSAETNGSIIDIDVFRESKIENFFSDFDKIIEKAHLEEKKIFFNLLTKEFLAKLKPEYSNGKK